MTKSCLSVNHVIEYPRITAGRCRKIRGVEEVKRKKNIICVIQSGYFSLCHLNKSQNKITLLLGFYSMFHFWNS